MGVCCGNYQSRTLGRGIGVSVRKRSHRPARHFVTPALQSVLQTRSCPSDSLNTRPTPEPKVIALLASTAWYPVYPVSWHHSRCTVSYPGPAQAGPRRGRSSPSSVPLPWVTGTEQLTILAPHPAERDREHQRRFDCNFDPLYQPGEPGAGVRQPGDSGSGTRDARDPSRGACPGIRVGETGLPCRRARHPRGDPRNPRPAERPRPGGGVQPAGRRKLGRRAVHAQCVVRQRGAGSALAQGRQRAVQRAQAAPPPAGADRAALLPAGGHRGDGPHRDDSVLPLLDLRSPPPHPRSARSRRHASSTNSMPGTTRPNRRASAPPTSLPPSAMTRWRRGSSARPSTPSARACVAPPPTG